MYLVNYNVNERYNAYYEITCKSPMELYVNEELMYNYGILSMNHY